VGTYGDGTVGSEVTADCDVHHIGNSGASARTVLDKITAGGRDAMELNVRPVPVPDPISQFYWDAAKSGVLAIQGFPEIGVLQHPPSPVPEVPGGAEGTPVAVNVSGRGTLFAYTILHQPFHPGFVDAVPLIIGLTELDDAPGVRILTNVVEADPAELRCGLPMEVVFEQRGEFALPQFRPVRDTTL
jgi:uncharacterized protein